MKGYFVYFEGKDQYGVKKKIAGQIKALSSFSEVTEINASLKSESVFSKIKSRFPFWGYGYDYEAILNQITEPDYIYIRHTLVDQDYVAFLKEVKRRFPRCKIIVELYTYPYDKDFYWRKGTWPLYIKEVLFRGKLKNYIDRFVTLTEDDDIFGVKTIKTVNGIDLENVPLYKRNERDDSTVRLISVAVMQKHHGFERLIEGIHQYYLGGGTRDIQYDVVGNTVGDEVEKYLKMAESYKLADHIHFLGSKKGRELDELVVNADIGVCSLGSYKLGIDATSQLKSREYLATGIPMLTGCRIDVLEGSGFPYYVEFPNDPTPIDMQKVIDFYDGVYVKSGMSRNEIAKAIREFAERTVDVNKVMEPVHAYIESNEL